MNSPLYNEAVVPLIYPVFRGLRDMSICGSLFRTLGDPKQVEFGGKGHCTV